jgi:hypothetical protein
MHPENDRFRRINCRKGEKWEEFRGIATETNLRTILWLCRQCRTIQKMIVTSQCPARPTCRFDFHQLSQHFPRRMSIALYRFASPVSIFRRLRLHRWWQCDWRIQLVPHYRTQNAIASASERRNNLSVVFYGSGCSTAAVRRLAANKNRVSTLSQPRAYFGTYNGPSDQTESEPVAGTISDATSEMDSIDGDQDKDPGVQNDTNDWWEEMEPLTAATDDDETDDVGTDDHDVGAVACSATDTALSPEILDYLSSAGVSPVLPKAKAKKRRVASSLEPPDTTIYHNGKPTYFQWDYRNHRRMEGTSHIKILRKIEQALKDAHLEPYGKRRGVRTVRLNILALDRGTQFRLASTKTFVKIKNEETYRNGSKIPSRKLVTKRIHRLLQTGRLVDTMMRLIYDRHTIRTCRHTANIGTLDRYVIGESFFGPTTHILMTAKTAKLILKELWLYGRSRTFSKMQSNHNFYQEMLKRRIRAEWLNQ